LRQNISLSDTQVLQMDLTDEWIPDQIKNKYNIDDILRINPGEDFDKLQEIITDETDLNIYIKAYLTRRKSRLPLLTINPAIIKGTYKHARLNYQDRTYNLLGMDLNISINFDYLDNGVKYTLIKMDDYFKIKNYPSPLEQIKYIITEGIRKSDANTINLIKKLKQSDKLYLFASTIINELTNYAFSNFGDDDLQLLKATPIMYAFYNILLVFKLFIDGWQFPQLFIDTQIQEYDRFKLIKS
jgi:hypothetical protein